jgi:hypothetical protein
VLKDIPASELAAAVRTVASGGALLAPSVTRRLIGRFTEQLSVDTSVARRLQRLTDREREVVGGRRPRLEQRRDRGADAHRRRDREVARVQHPDQAGAA